MPLSVSCRFMVKLFKLKNLIPGTLGILDKTRHLFMHDRTRLHLDVVKNKGAAYYGLEFEVMLQPDEDIETGNQVAEELMKIFELKKEQLMEGSYFEILNA
jgi:adenylate cyclase class IV